MAQIENQLNRCEEIPREIKANKNNNSTSAEWNAENNRPGPSNPSNSKNHI